MTTVSGRDGSSRSMVDEVIERAATAAAAFRELDQEQTDRIVAAVYRAGFDERIRLAVMARQETRLGVVRDKVLKNVLATRHVWEDIRDLRTVGRICEHPEQGILEIAQPVGPIIALTPVTNPTSTVLFKILIALKTRNPIVIRPHGAARRCSIEAARICAEAARAAGAPEGCIQWVAHSSEAETHALMAHRKTALVLATGSVSLVRAAYRSGNPAIGIGPGNVPCYIGKSADFPFAVEQILLSKTFDNGTVCASEQAVIVRRPYAEQIVELFRERGAYFLSQAEIRRIEPVAFNLSQRVMSAQVIGQPAQVIAAMAGIEVPESTTVLVAPLDRVGLESPLSLEILAPILAFYVAETFDLAIDLCCSINVHGGLGHTASIFSTDEASIEYFAGRLNAGRILVNTPASQGALGGTFNDLTPSFTLGVGTHGKTTTTDNITARHLLNIQRVARRRLHPCLTCTDRFCMDGAMSADVVDLHCTRHLGGPCPGSTQP